jgi:hypothetical protein
MAGRIVKLGPGECPNMETGARYFAALAFPGAHEDRARQDAARGWVGAYLHEANRVDGSNEPLRKLEELKRVVSGPLRDEDAAALPGLKRRQVFLTQVLVNLVIHKEWIDKCTMQIAFS